MRSSSGEPFRVLVCPIYTCLREVCIQIHSLFIHEYANSQSYEPIYINLLEDSVELCVYRACLERYIHKPEFPVFGQT